MSKSNSDQPPPNFWGPQAGHLRGYAHFQVPGPSTERRRSGGETHMDPTGAKRGRMELLHTPMGLHPVAQMPINMTRQSIIETISTAVERRDHATLRTCLSQCRVERAVVRDPFLRAVEAGDHHSVSILLTGDYRPNLNLMTLRDGSFPIFWAVSKGNIDLVRALLSRPLGPKQVKDLRDERQMTPIVLATERGHPHIVRALVESKFDVNSAHCGQHALHIACRLGDPDMVQTLLECGAKPGVVTDTEHDTALIVAVDRAGRAKGRGAGVRQIVGLLLAKKININAINKLNETALFKSAISGDPEVVQLLLDKGADPDVRRAPCETSGPSVCGEAPLFVAMENKHYDTFRRIIATRRVRLHIPNKTLHYLDYAAKIGWEEFFKCLLAAGANPNWVGPNGMTSVHTVAINGSDVNMELLVTYGANIDAIMADGSTPIMLASRYLRVDTARVLIKYNCDLNRRDLQGKDALDILLEWAGNLGQDIIMLLLEAGLDARARLLSMESNEAWPTGESGEQLLSDEFIDRLVAYNHRPRQLKTQCRIRLRQILGNSYVQTLDRLKHLPQSVRGFLMFSKAS